MTLIRWELARLPGPRRHLQAVSDDLDEGLSCVWLVPDCLVESGVATDLLNQLAARADSIRVPKPEVATTEWTARPQRVFDLPAEPMPSWVDDGFGLLDDLADEPTAVHEIEEATRSVSERLLALAEYDDEEPDDALRSLVSTEWLRGKVIVVCAWDEPDPADVGGLLVKLTATVKEKGQEPGQRPRLLVAARQRDLPVAVRERLDPVTARVHWWWGAVGRLDTAVVVTEARPLRSRRSTPDRVSPIRELVATEVITEIAGPDLRLAEWLSSSWDGTLKTLHARIAELPYDLPLLPETGTPDNAVGGFRPPQGLRDAWSLGVVELWDGQLRISPALPVAVRSVDLDSLVWRGQNRALTPLLDEHRARLEEVIRGRLRTVVLKELAANDRYERGRQDTLGSARDALEIGKMAWLVATRRVNVSTADRRLLACLRDVRNRLAHLGTISDDDMERLVEVLPTGHRYPQPGYNR